MILLYDFILRFDQKDFLFSHHNPYLYKCFEFMINICEQARIKYLKTNTMCWRPKSTQNTKQNKVHGLILAVFMLIWDKSATGDK